jgi:putative FmdB family regulatory protein
MPLYTYECTNCGVVFERQQKFTDAPVKRCPECNKSAIKKIIQPAGIIFKGSGWYKTDSRSSSTSTSTPSKKSPAKSESKGESKTEAKPADSGSASSTAPAKTASDSSDD